MKKAPWFHLAQSRPAETLDQPADELRQYQCLLRAGCRTRERAEEERRYQARVKEWLRLPENRWCRVYLVLRGRRVRATQCHHYQGRRGMLLLYEPFWIPVSWEGHRLIEDHREQARALGLLCPLGCYNSPVRTPRS
jgi:hypothetical protein